ncbi:hypothetical protein HNY73_007500 [Argiope bruennichi]|uniref:Capsid protein n=1 Tax=Argiope bruennichi TaxID=94029 RepID=A0A8T0FJM1_ARGBR|nr:hypothetical protein HNY73_007500 [Argiope bruennichi]
MPLTAPSQGTAGQVLTSRNRIKPEDPPTNSTKSADNTTSNPLHWAPKKPTLTSFEKHQKRAGGEISSPESSRPNLIFEDYQVVNTSQEKANPQTYDTPKGLYHRLLTNPSNLINNHLPLKKRTLIEKNTEDKQSKKICGSNLEKCHPQQTSTQHSAPTGTLDRQTQPNPLPSTPEDQLLIQTMTPVNTGTVMLFFQRLFWHYFTVPPAFDQCPKDLDDIYQTGWLDIPYQHICCSMNPRQWQYINIIAKRWRVKTFGFKMSHFIPFKNDIKSDGGAVGPTLTYMVNSSLQTYIDKGYCMPITTYNNLPNNNMAFSIGNQTNSQLQQITWPRLTINGAWDDNKSYKAYIESQMQPLISLENSKEFEILPNEGVFSFEHTLGPREYVWRSGLYPTNADKTNNPSWGAHPLGRWDGGIANADSTDQPNWSRLQQHIINPTRPALACLIRPNIIFDVKNNLDQIWYQRAIKYHAWVEVDMNDTLNTPVWLRKYTTVDKTTSWDIFNTSASRSTRDAELQCSGSNAIPILAGPKNGAFVL